MNEENCMNSGDSGTPEIAREVSLRRFAKVVVVALAVAGFAAAGLSGALARHGADDGVSFIPSGGSATSASSGGSGWDDDWVFTTSGGSWDDDGVFTTSSGSGGSGWDD
jgi:hypothetical protein